MTSTPTRRCEDDACGLELELDVVRGDAKYCSNACRQRAYRRRTAILKRYGTDSWDVVLEALLSEHQQRVTDDARG